MGQTKTRTRASFFKFFKKQTLHHFSLSPFTHHQIVPTICTASFCDPMRTEACMYKCDFWLLLLLLTLQSVPPHLLSQQLCLSSAMRGYLCDEYNMIWTRAYEGRCWKNAICCGAKWKQRRSRWRVTRRNQSVDEQSKYQDALGNTP